MTYEVLSTLDVREVPPRIRHPQIFETFDALAPGQAFVLVNDHDPRPLFYQFQAERPGSFGWVSLEQGPEVWRVEISRALPAIGAGQTVDEVSRLYPGALDVMKEMGINHCCGGHLTLPEAAAAAGIALEALLQALDQARAAGA
jgi:regulator of cell morphogenesis and NO signaling